MTPPRRRPCVPVSSAASVQTGFTLVELLIALTLIGLLTVMLLGNLGFGTRAVTAASTTLDRSSQVAVAYGFLRNTLSNAQSMLDPAAPLRDQAIIFDGTRDHLEFATLPPAYLASGGFHRLTISLEGEGRERRLIVTWQLITRGMKTTETQELAPSTLIDKIGTAAFSYCCATAIPADQPPGKPAIGQPKWADRWPDSAGLPALVRLHLTFADGWQPPDLLVAPRQASLPQILQ